MESIWGGKPGQQPDKDAKLRIVNAWEKYKYHSLHQKTHCIQPRIHTNLFLGKHVIEYHEQEMFLM